MINKSFKLKLRNLSIDQYNLLFDLCSNSKNLYNQSLYKIREQYKLDKSYINYNQLDKIMKDTFNLENQINYKLLKAGVSQQILKRLNSNYLAYFAALKDYKNNPSKYTNMPKPPKYLKDKYYNLIYDNQRFQINKKTPNYINLEKGLSIRISDELMKLIKGNTKLITQVEIIPKYKHFICIIIYKDINNYKQVEKNENVVAIDLGLNNLATIVSNGVFKPLIVNGKPLKSINQFYNKLNSKYLSKLTKGKDSITNSKDGKTWSKRLQKITDNRNNQIKDYIHKSTKKVVEHCVKYDISKVIIGNVSNSTRNINIGKVNNQNFVNISLGQFIEKLKYKLELHNIKVIVREESYTSKASFIDNDTIPKKHNPEEKYTFSGKRVKRGLYRTKNNIYVNADVNGAYNILRKEIPKFNCKKLNEGIVDWFLPSKININC